MVMSVSEIQILNEAWNGKSLSGAVNGYNYVMNWTGLCVLLSVKHKLQLKKPNQPNLKALRMLFSY